MNQKLGRVLCWIAIIVFVQNAHPQDHLFDVKDLIEMTTINEPMEIGLDPKAKFSPNGEFAVLVTSRGNLSTNEVESSLWLYDLRTLQEIVADTASHREFPPRRLVMLHCSPVGEANQSSAALITDLRWSANSRWLYFLGQQKMGVHSLYRADVLTLRIDKVSLYGYDVRLFDIAVDAVVYKAWPQWRSRSRASNKSTPETNGVAESVTGLPLESILFPDTENQQTDVHVTELWAAKGDGAARRVPDPTHTLEQPDVDLVDSLSIAPDGHWAVGLSPVSTIPENWRQYAPPSSLDYLQIDPKNRNALSAHNVMRLKQYVLTNLETGKTRPLVNAPIGLPLGFGTLEKAIWSKNGRAVLLTNTYLPLPISAPQSTPAEPCAVAEIDLGSHDVRCITFGLKHESTNAAAPSRLAAKDVEFANNDHEVIVHFREDSHSTCARFVLEPTPAGAFTDTVTSLPCTGNGDRGVEKTQSAGLELPIKQTLNSHPTVWLVDTRTGDSKLLWDPNPQLVNIVLADAAEYEWTDAFGIHWSGALIKPVGYVPGRRYPLVVQTHGFQDNTFRFVTEGPFSTAMAARPLASAGIMVLQIPDHPSMGTVSLQELRHHVEGIVSGVQHLIADGLVDPSRVGIVGFSRTCWYVEQALISHPNLFVAGILADGIDQSYMQELLFHSNEPSEERKIYNARPTGSGLKTWLQLAPDFNLEKVRAAIRLEAIGPRSLLMEWEIYSSLLEQSKAVDLFYIPNGQHILQKPLERLASQQGTVDWFRFWLERYERPNPEDPDQYKRWEHLRELRDADYKTAGIPLPDIGNASPAITTDRAKE